MSVPVVDNVSISSSNEDDDKNVLATHPVENDLVYPIMADLDDNFQAALKEFNELQNQHYIPLEPNGGSMWVNVMHQAIMVQCC